MGYGLHTDRNHDYLILLFVEMAEFTQQSLMGNYWPEMKIMGSKKWRSQVLEVLKAFLARVWVIVQK